MTKNNFYGEYKSSQSSSSGCVNGFMTAPSEDNLFPAQVSSFCELCDKEHAFYLAASYAISTKGQQIALERYCDNKNYRYDIIIKK